MVVDTEYYDALNVSVEATQDEIRKAYRRMAVKTHPDKNPGDEEAKAKFQAVGEAYQVLNDPQLRERYDKHGKEAAVPDSGFEDPMDLVVHIFGGEAFQPWIGEISMFKDMMEMASEEDTTATAAEAGAETSGAAAAATAAEAAGGAAAATAAAETGAETGAEAAGASSSASASAGSSTAAPAAPASSSPGPGHAAATTATSSATATGTGTSATPLLQSHGHDHEAHAAHTAAEQKAARQQRKEQERRVAEASREARQQRIDQLTKNLENKLSAVTEQWSTKFITSNKPTGQDEALLSSFIAQCQIEADKLKMESFGLELLHTIGQVYYTRSNIYIKSHKSLFGMGGLFSSVKEKGSIIKDGWNTLSVAMDAANSIKNMSEAEEDTLTPEEKALRDQGIMGNVLVALWSGTRFELQGILRQVADNLLYDSRVDNKVKVARARAMLELGRVFKNTTRTAQEAEEVQMFESLVADAMMDKKKKKQRSKKPVS